MNGTTSFSGDLIAELVRAPQMHKIKSIRTPLGRLMFTRDRGESVLVSEHQFISNCTAVHRDGDGKLIGQHDLGSGLVTNVGVLALAIDGLPVASANAWPQTNAPTSTLQKAKFHASGTSATGAAVTDIKLNAASGFGGQTPVSGTQVLVVPSGFGTMPKYETVATIAYTGTETVQEWILLTSGTLTATTGSPFTAGSSTSGTVTASALTASSTTVQGQTQTVFDNTNATRVSWGLCVSNTTGVVTVPAWYLTASGLAGTAPVNADTYVIRPIALDHKQFTGIGVNAGDSIAFTYDLAITSGG